MGWMDIDQLLGFTTNKMTYRILYNRQPELLHYRLTKDKKVNPICTRLSGPYKMGPHPT